MYFALDVSIELFNLRLKVQCTRNIGQHSNATSYARRDELAQSQKYICHVYTCENGSADVVWKNETSLSSSML